MLYGTYYGASIPNLHRLRAPLNKTLSKNIKLDWSKICQGAFEKIKKLLVSDLLLAQYDTSLPIAVASDASNYDIGAITFYIMPDGSVKVISHAAVSLNTTTTGRNCSRIEKEALSSIFAIKFHKTTFGHQFTFLTDHEQLLTIFGSEKGIPVYEANRLQR